MEKIPVARTQMTPYALLHWMYSQCIGASQEQVAQALGTTSVTLSRLVREERGDTPDDAWFRIVAKTITEEYPERSQLYEAALRAVWALTRVRTSRDKFKRPVVSITPDVDAILQEAYEWARLHGYVRDLGVERTKGFVAVLSEEEAVKLESLMKRDPKEAEKAEKARHSEFKSMSLK